MGDKCNRLVFQAFLSTTLPGNWDEDWPFQSRVFQICWHIECNTLISSFFRVWNSSAGIPSPPLALLTGMLPNAHLTSHSQTSGSEWETTPPWLSIIKIFFVLVLCILAISSWSLILGLYPSLFFIVPVFRWNVPLIFPIFLKKSLILPFLLFSLEFLVINAAFK